MIEAERISFSYSKQRQVLEDISFSLIPGEVLGVVGPNGAGKSTLIRCLNRLLFPTEGRVLLKGKDIRTYPGRTIAGLVGYVPQKHSATFPCKVIEVVMAGMGKPGNRLQAGEQAGKAVTVLEDLQMESMALRNFSTLSGGEQQKVVIARVIASQTPVMLFDEPTSNLDIRYQFETLKLVKEMAMHRDYSVVIAIHDLNMALRFCHRILLLDGGKVKDIGLPEQVMTEPNLREIFGIETEFIRQKEQKILIMKDAI